MEGKLCFKPSQKLLLGMISFYKLCCVSNYIMAKVAHVYGVEFVE